MVCPNHKIKPFILAIIKSQEAIKNLPKYKKILLALLKFSNHKQPNLLHEQTQTEYYLIGPKILIMVLYSTFLQIINLVFSPLES